MGLWTELETDRERSGSSCTEPRLLRKSLGVCGQAQDTVT